MSKTSRTHTKLRAVGLLLALVALLVMHGLTTPSGHHTAVTHRLDGPADLRTDADARSAHGDATPNHKALGAGCVAFVVVLGVSLARPTWSRRVPSPALGQVPDVTHRPDPPVPRGPLVV